MKRILPALLAFALVGCNLPDPQEAARLKSENETLQAQIQTLTTERDTALRERDDLRSRLQAIKDALENIPSSVIATPAPSTPETVPAPSTPDTAPPAAIPETVPPSTPESTLPSTPETTPPETMPAPSTPDSSGDPDIKTTPTLPPVTASPDTPALEKLRKYADDVLTAAQNFKAQTRQEAPTNCQTGYAAGAYNVQKSLELKECTVVAEANGDYRVTARDMAGNSVSLP